MIRRPADTDSQVRATSHSRGDAAAQLAPLDDGRQRAPVAHCHFRMPTGRRQCVARLADQESC